MTKQEFLNGKSFSLPYTYSSTTTYRADEDKKCLIQELRTKEGKVIISDYRNWVCHVATKQNRNFE